MLLPAPISLVSLQVRIALLNGRMALLPVRKSDSVLNTKQRAEKVLGVEISALVGGDGTVLDEYQTLEEAGLDLGSEAPPIQAVILAHELTELAVEEMNKKRNVTFLDTRWPTSLPSATASSSQAKQEDKLRGRLFVLSFPLHAGRSTAWHSETHEISRRG